MAAQIVTITLPTPPSGATHFRLQFSSTGGDPFTPYSTISASPSTAEDLPVGLLVAGSYVIDGVNAPSGDMLAASAPGLYYEAQWKVSGLYTPWGPGFGVTATRPAPGWPTLADVLTLIAPGGDALPAGLTSQLTAQILPELARVQAEFEGPVASDGTGGTGRLFTPTVVLRRFTGNGRLRLPVREFVRPEDGGSALLVKVDGVTITGYQAGHSLRAAPPWDELHLGAAATVARWFPTAEDNIEVTATWGWSLTVPADVAGAVACEVARRALVRAKVPLSGIGNMTTIGPISENTAAGVSVWVKSSPIAIADEIFQQRIKNYRDDLQVLEKAVGPRNARAFWGGG